jgi:2-pyrone-4,6-dicarboxylate lactonase
VRYVFVKPSAYGFDNSCMLDSMRELDPSIRRGIIDLDENNTSDRELADLDITGVRGIRLNISPIRKPEAGLAASMLPRIGRLANGRAHGAVSGQGRAGAAGLPGISGAGR